MQAIFEIVVDTHLGVHVVTGNIDVGNVLSKLFPQFALQLFKVEGLHVETRTGVDPGSITDDLGPKGLGESAGRLSQVTLEELDDGFGEVELVGPLRDVVFAEVVAGHELSQVTDDLGTGSDLDNVTTKLVGKGVVLLDLVPMGSETELSSLDGERTGRQFGMPRWHLGRRSPDILGRTSLRIDCATGNRQIVLFHPSPLLQSTHPPGISCSKTLESLDMDMASLRTWCEWVSLLDIRAFGLQCVTHKGL